MPATKFSKTLLNNLGIEFHPPSKEICLNDPHAQGVDIVATMPVDERTIQPFGFLSGGASLALAESLAGYASRLYCKPEYYPLGMQVSANHLASVAYDAAKQQQVIAKAKPIHVGSSTHVWDVEIKDEQGRCISVVRITNIILPIRN